MMRLQQNCIEFGHWLTGLGDRLKGQLCLWLGNGKAVRARRLVPVRETDGWQGRSQGLWRDGVSTDWPIGEEPTGKGPIGEVLESNYWAASTAPAETLWQIVTDLADLASWHPLITRTNAPMGQCAKPGLIYKAFSRYLPLPTQIFVERVLPGELLSVRLFPLPGLQERVTYRIVSTLCGTCVLYSVTLSGWLSPLAWLMVKPHATRVAAALVQAAEQATLQPRNVRRRLCRADSNDIFS
ncbi:hypothetical protein BH23CYA1_BH23CYA1_01770 [soil metagenome]